MILIKLCFILSLSYALASCADTKKNKEEKTIGATSDTGAAKKQNEAPAVAKTNNKTITAKFTAFELGDISHFIFTDQSGKTWDFSDNEDKKYEFAKELSKSESNETNQGYGSNKTLQGKTFELQYKKRDGRALTENRMDSVLVIVAVTPKD